MSKKQPSSSKSPELPPVTGNCCLNCKFYFVSEMLCRRYPPQNLVTKREKPDKAWWQGAFPKMTPDGWCGEWKPVLQ